MRTIGAQIGCSFRAIHYRIEAAGGGRLSTNGVDATVGTAPAGHLHQAIVDTILAEVDGLRTTVAFCHAQSLGHPVYRDYTFCTEHPCALDRELPDGAASPDRNCVAVLHLTIFGGHVTRGKNVGQKQHLII